MITFNQCNNRTRLKNRPNHAGSCPVGSRYRLTVPTAVCMCLVHMQSRVNLSLLHQRIVSPPLAAFPRARSVSLRLLCCKHSLFSALLAREKYVKSVTYKYSTQPCLFYVQLSRNCCKMLPDDLKARFSLNLTLNGLKCTVARFIGYTDRHSTSTSFHDYHTICIYHNGHSAFETILCMDHMFAC